MANTELQNNWFQKWFPWLLTGLSVVALTASFWQAAERIKMLKDPGVVLNCNINPIVDCGGVMSHKLAALFGFPNTFIGMVMFSMLLMSGVALLAGAKVNQRFRTIVLTLSTIAILFSFWFFWASLYEIGKICIFCLFIWPASIGMFWFAVQYWLEGLKKPSSYQVKLQNFASRYKIEPIIAVYLIMLVLFLFRFRDYYFS